MKSVLAFVAILILGCATVTFAQPKTFKQAKTQSAQTGKPILLEFVHED